MLSHVLFFLALVAVGYIINKVIKWPADFETLKLFGLTWPIARWMVNFFLGLILVLWVLGLIGVGR